MLREIYSRTTLLGHCRGRIYMHYICLFITFPCSLTILSPLKASSTSLRPSFSAHSLQIYCTRLFGSQSIHLLDLRVKARPYNIYIYIYNSKSLSNIKQLNNFLLNLYFENSIIRSHDMHTNFHVSWIFFTILSINLSFMHYFKLQKLEFEQLIDNMTINL